MKISKGKSKYFKEATGFAAGGSVVGSGTTLRFWSNRSFKRHSRMQLNDARDQQRIPSRL